MLAATALGCSSARQATTSAMCLRGGGEVEEGGREGSAAVSLGGGSVGPGSPLAPLPLASLPLKLPSPLPPSLDGSGVGAGRLLVVPLRVRPDKLLDQAQGLQQYVGQDNEVAAKKKEKSGGVIFVWEKMGGRMFKMLVALILSWRQNPKPLPPPPPACSDACHPQGAALVA